jgi:hypothetical protein
MSRDWRIVVAILALMLLLAAMSEPAGLRLLLHHPGTVNRTWLIIALAANLARVLLLALTVGVCGYFMSQPENEPAEWIQLLIPETDWKQAHQPPTYFSWFPLGGHATTRHRPIHWEIALPPRVDPSALRSGQPGA